MLIGVLPFSRLVDRKYNSKRNQQLGMGGQRGLRCGCLSRIAIVLVVIALSLGSAAAGIQLHLGEEECGSVGGFSFRSLFLLSSPTHISFTTKPHSTHPSTC